jgi:hypothetical protein
MHTNHTRKKIGSSAERKARKCIQGRKEAGGPTQKDNKTGNTCITMRCIHATIEALEKQKCYIFCVYICSLRYVAGNAHAPYCHLWPACLLNIFPHYLTNGTFFKKKLLKTKCVILFSTTFI